jgi:phenylpropionate dioxygenase-like ring-hydroxylating dioxygenase large terminal subunit
MVKLARELTDEAPVGATITSGARQPVTIPASRYTDPAFADLERQRLWPRVWQLACSTDHVAQPGDAYEYRCGPYSIVIVRDDDAVLRAFQNVCRHRGSAICEGAASGLTELRCPFHRWSWDLSGRLREVPSRRGFGSLPSEQYGLFPVAVDTWGPFVFVDPSSAAGPLETFLEGVPQDIAWVGLDEYRCDYLVTVPLPGNWKIISDGFSETYHVQGLHREMLPTVDDVNGPQRLWQHHGKLEQRYGLPSPRFREPPSVDVVWSSFVEIMGTRVGVSDVATPVPPIPPGQTLRDVLATKLRELGPSQGLSYDRFSNDQLMTMQQYNLFPNASLVIFPDMMTVLRSRPGATPDDGYLDIINYHRAPPGAPAGRPADVTLPEGQGSGLGLILSQDAGNIERAQRGLHQPGFTRMTLSREEFRILNLHRNLEQWLGITPTEITGDE